MLRTMILWTVLVLPASAQTTPRSAEVYGDWTILRTQNPAEPCLLQQVVQSSETRRTLLEGLLSRATDPADPPVLSFVVPNGVSLASGIGYRHAGEDAVQQLDWLYCTPDACLAARQLSAQDWTAIRRGAELFAGYRPLPGAQPILVPVSLMGVTRGWAAVEACGG